MNNCCLNNFVPFDQVKYGGATYTRINTVVSIENLSKILPSSGGAHVRYQQPSKLPYL